MKYRIYAVVLLIVAFGFGYGIYASELSTAKGFLAKFPFKLGLDLAGGTELLYTADTSKLASGDVSDSMAALRDVIETRVNAFGVSEPVVQVQKSGALGNGSDQLLVELPGVTDVQAAIDQIGKTPVLEFKLAEIVPVGGTSATSTGSSTVTFTDTGLTGRYLERSMVQFDPNTNAPVITLQFNNEGQELFAELTKAHVGKPLAIFLDGNILSMPYIREQVLGGQAQITGSFTTKEAQTLVRNLNYGALPVPISLSSTQSIGPSLGEAAVNAGVFAGIVGFAALALFLLFWYRLPGLIAVIALALYVILSLVIFKLIPVTMTAAGIAGFILSVGMAVDANILIFERMKEELKRGKSVSDAIHEGFHRAWLSIRDSNISSIITACVLFWLGTSSVKGFALTLGVGVAVSMFTAITASRTFLYSIAPKKSNAFSRFLFSNGLHIK